MKAANNTSLAWSEDKLQAEFFLWFHNKFPMYRGLLVAIPNGGHRPGLEGKVLKATGTWPGVSDMMFLWDKTPYFLELKKPAGGRQSDEQKTWQAQIESQGFTYLLMNDFLELRQFVLNVMTDWTEVNKFNKPHPQIKLEL